MTIYIFPGVIKHIIPAVASTNAVVAGKLICSFYVCMVNINIKLALYTHIYIYYCKALISVPSLSIVVLYVVPFTGN